MDLSLSSIIRNLTTLHFSRLPLSQLVMAHIIAIDANNPVDIVLMTLSTRFTAVDVVNNICKKRIFDDPEICHLIKATRKKCKKQA